MSDSTSGQTPPPDSLIDYPGLVDRAMRQVVRFALEQAEDGELPGQHYFYISFATQFPGVVISEDLRAQHPETLSIVLQYQFENLLIDKDHFEVTLYFGGEPRHLSVPYEAVLGFVDPYVSFSLQFPQAGEEFDDEEGGDLADAGQARPSYLRALSLDDPEGFDLEPASKSPNAKKTEGERSASAEPEDTDAAKPDVPSAGGAETAADDDPQTAQPDDGSNVVSLDQFRKK